MKIETKIDMAYQKYSDSFRNISNNFDPETINQEDVLAHLIERRTILFGPWLWCDNVDSILKKLVNEGYLITGDNIIGYPYPEFNASYSYYLAEDYPDKIWHE